MRQTGGPLEGVCKRKDGVGGRSFSLWILVAFLSIPCLGMGSHQANSDTVLTIEALYRRFNVPTDCSASIDWAGKTVTLRGVLDAANIYDKAHYPNLPYEKFRLTDAGGRSVEIWPDAGDNSAIFNKLSARPSDEATITGILEAVKLPISGGCKLGIKVVIDHADQIEFR